MAASIVAALLIVALASAAASSTREPNKPKWTSNCLAIPCKGILKDVKFSEEVIDKFMDVETYMIIDSSVPIERGSYMRIVLYKEDEILREQERVPLDAPFPIEYLGYSMELQPVPLPLYPGEYVYIIKSRFEDWETSYYMMNMIIRNQNNTVVMDAKLILDDEKTAASGDLILTDHTPQHGRGWLEGWEMEPNPAYVEPDTTVRLDLFVGHEDELKAGAKWVFCLRRDGDEQHAQEWTLEDPQPIERGAMYLAMNPVSLPMPAGKSVITFYADFRYPSTGGWTLEAELVNEDGSLIVFLEFSADVHNP